MPRKVSKKDSKFLWIGNSAFLDFVNTRIVQGGHPVDLLAGAEDLLHWLKEAGFSVKLAIKPNDVQQMGELLAAARGYRHALRSAVQHIAAEGSVPSQILSRTNQFLERRNHWFELTEAHPEIAVRDRWIVDSPQDICSPIARSFAQFVSSADLGRVRKCKNPDCVLVFYDTSKSGTRAWCSLDLCGNKLRVAAFRRRAEK